MLRRVNEALDGRIHQPAYSKVVKRVFAQSILAGQSSAPAQCPPDLVERLAVIATRQNRRIGNRGYQVHGDLGELVPAAGAGSWVDPDAVDPELEAAAAVAAIAELLVENAEPEPDPGLVPTARRVGGRLRSRLARLRGLGSARDGQTRPATPGLPPRRQPEDRHHLPPGRAVVPAGDGGGAGAACCPANGSTTTSWPPSTSGRWPADPIYPDRARGIWDRLVAEALAWDGAVLISHELFAGATAEQARRAVATLAGRADVHVVVTARDHVRQISAEWQEHVKHRSRRNLREFVRAVRDDRARTSWFWQVQDYAAVLERWGAGPAARAVHVVTVPPAGADPTILWDRFARLLGVDPAAFDTELERSNSSLGVEQSELLRRVNLELGDRLPLPGPYPLVVKNVLAHRMLEARTGTRLTLGADDREFAADATRGIADRLAAIGADVVGDLADLVPATGVGDPTPADAYAIPSDATLLAESVAAIADLLVVLNERRAAVQRAEDLTTTAEEKPLRFALVRASERRPLLRKLRGAYRAARARPSS